MLLTARHRSARNFFLLYVCSIWIALVSALPVVSAAFMSPQAPAAEWPGIPRQQALVLPRSPYRTFEQLDRNADGALDKSEVAPIPGMSANFERADRDENGVLDRTEFARALATLLNRR
ncbi:MAG TPA: hypothetical protein VHL85_06435 [Burkholderiales bacterium]|nr:hypothetical protein [Burkholderiales bacterium]